ncbi:hypothetical protein EON77_10645, partial [bacterium]
MHRTATLRDGTGRVELRLNYAKGCTIDRMRTLGTEVASEERGLWSGVQIGGRWHTTADSVKPPKVVRNGDRLRVSGLAYGPEGMRIVEGWTFTVKSDGVVWKIDRRYEDGGTLDGTAMPSMTFRSMQTW